MATKQRKVRRRRSLPMATTRDVWMPCNRPSCACSSSTSCATFPAKLSIPSARAGAASTTVARVRRVIPPSGAAARSPEGRRFVGAPPPVSAPPGLRSPQLAADVASSIEHSPPGMLRLPSLLATRARLFLHCRLNSGAPEVLFCNPNFRLSWAGCGRWTVSGGSGIRGND